METDGHRIDSFRASRHQKDGTNSKNLERGPVATADLEPVSLLTGSWVSTPAV